MSKRAKYAVTIILILFAAVLRLLYLTKIPLGMHIDEAGLGLNAWSIAQFGTDRYGNFLPICPSNFYGEQSAFYTYFSAFLVRFFGLNLWTIRLPGAIMGIISVIFGSLIAREKWGDKGFFTGMVLFSIFPYFIMSSRYALDCNAMLGMFSIALYCLLRTVRKARTAQEHDAEPDRIHHYSLFLLTGVLLGLVLYTYIIAAIVIALFCILFGTTYLFCDKRYRGLRFKQLCFLAIPLFVMAIPLILVFCVNYFDWKAIETPFFTIPKMLVNRTEEVTFSFSELFIRVKRLRYPLTSDGIYGSSKQYWTMYPFSVPFVLFGGLFSLRSCLLHRKENRLSTDSLLLMATLSEIVLFLICGRYNYHINGIFVLLGYFCLNGLMVFYHYIQGRRAKYAYIILCTALYGLSFYGFCREYFGAETTDTYMVYNGVNEAMQLLPPEKEKNRIFVLDEVGEIYFLSNPKEPGVFLPYYNEVGHLFDFENLHFHDPEDYRPGDVIIGNRAGQRYQNYIDINSSTEFTLLETDHYYVFYE